MKIVTRSRPFRAIVTTLAGTAAFAAGCNEATQQAGKGPAGTGDQQLVAAPRLPTNAPAGATPTQQLSATTAPPAASPAGPAAVGPEKAAPPPPASSMPPIPPDARFTIFCYAVKGTGHVEGAVAARDSLVRKTGRSDWYVIVGHEESNLYFGFYPALDGPHAAATNADLKMIKELRDSSNRTPFERSIFVSLDAPDPTSPPEWNLFNVDRALAPKDPKRAYWTLQVAAFHANPMRKEAAVDAVRGLREKGYEAYYYHGEFVSSVTVGRWPASAVKAQNDEEWLPDVADTGRDPSRHMVATNFDLKDHEVARPVDGKRAVSVAPKLEVLDPTMKEIMAKLPNHLVNYESAKKTDKNGNVYYEPSFLVVIPRAKGNGLYDSEKARARPEPHLDRPSRPSMIGPGR